MNASLTLSHPFKIFQKLIAQNKTNRLETLLATFADGYAEGWAFPIASQFREAIDIRFTTQKVNKIPEQAWTQGSRFEFREGYTVYDTREAYETSKTALQHVKVAFQIQKSSPAIPAAVNLQKWPTRPDDAEIKRYIALFGQNYVSHGEEVKKKEYILRVQTKRFAGYLEVAKLVPDDQKQHLVKVDEFPISQDHFVEWLITGTDPSIRTQEGSPATSTS
ncbi:hypothetical protein K9F62_17105 [Desulfovibrio sp. JY]|nr:hypothetical protein K9F62_17105 [Desulfovibrio sp. JY]